MGGKSEAEGHSVKKKARNTRLRDAGEDYAVSAPGAKAASSNGTSAKGSARREEILTGLMQKIARQELRNPSLRELGKAIGIEPAHILYYFDSREALLQAVIMRWDEEARISAINTEQTLETFVEQIRRNIKIPGIVHLYLSFAAEAIDPQHAAHDFFQRRFERVRATLTQRILREQKEGKIADHIDADAKARQLLALADGLQLQSLVDPSVDAAGDLYDAIAGLRIRT